MKGITQSRGAAISQQKIFLNGVSDVHMGLTVIISVALARVFLTDCLQGRVHSWSRISTSQLQWPWVRERSKLKFVFLILWTKWFPRQIIKSFHFEKTSKIIESKLWPNTTVSTKSHTGQELPHPLVSWTLPGTGLLHPLPRWPIPMIKHYFTEEILPDIQPGPPLAQLFLCSLPGQLPGKKGQPLPCVPQELICLFYKECCQMQNIRSTKKQINLF